MTVILFLTALAALLLFIPAHRWLERRRCEARGRLAAKLGHWPPLPGEIAGWPPPPKPWPPAPPAKRGAAIIALVLLPLLAGCGGKFADIFGLGDPGGPVCGDIYLTVRGIPESTNVFEVLLYDRAGNTVKQSWDITTCGPTIDQCERKGFTSVFSLANHKAGTYTVTAASAGCEKTAGVTVQ